MRRFLTLVTAHCPISSTLGPRGAISTIHLSSTTPSYIEYLSDLTTAGCYYAIPIQLLYFLAYNPVPLPWRYRLIILLFAAFILLCGSSHLIMVLLADQTVTSELALPVMKL